MKLILKLKHPRHSEPSLLETNQKQKRKQSFHPRIRPPSYRAVDVPRQEIKGFKGATGFRCGCTCLSVWGFFGPVFLASCRYASSQPFDSSLNMCTLPYVTMYVRRQNVRQLRVIFGKPARAPASQPPSFFVSSARHLRLKSLLGTRRLLEKPYR